MVFGVLGILTAYSAPLATALVPVDVSQLAAEAHHALEDEVIYLVGLRALKDPLPDELEKLFLDNKADLVDRLNREDLISGLRSSDLEGSGALNALRATGAPLSDAVSQVLDVIPLGGMNAITNSRPLDVDPGQYVRALSDLDL